MKMKMTMSMTMTGFMITHLVDSLDETTTREKPSSAREHMTVSDKLDLAAYWIRDVVGTRGGGGEIGNGGNSGNSGGLGQDKACFVYLVNHDAWGKVIAKSDPLFCSVLFCSVLSCAFLFITIAVAQLPNPN